MKMKFFDNDVKSEEMAVQRIYNFEDFDAVYVDSSDRYQQKDYDRILNCGRNKSINLWAWKNDKAVAEFAILCADKELSNVSVKASDLNGESGAIPSSLVKLSFVKEVKAYNGHAGWYANNPGNIMPRGKREYYPEVIYSDEPISVDYILEVLDITMPDAANYLFDTEYWSHPYNVAYYYDVEPFSDRHLEILKQHMEIYKNLGGHAVTASIVEEAWGGQTYGYNRDIHYPSMIKWIKTADGNWKFDYTHFDAMEKCYKVL